MDNDPVGDVIFAIVCLLGFAAFALIALNL
jgi:hypothetical protein